MNKLIEKIQEAVPEIWHWDGKSPVVQIRDIRLADVLLAFEKQRKLVSKRLWLTSKGYLNYTSFNYETMYAQTQWDLTKDLDGQSDECKKFLNNLLIKR